MQTAENCERDKKNGPFFAVVNSQPGTLTGRIGLMFFTLRETRTFDTRGNSGLTGGLGGSAALCILTQYY